MLEFLTRLYEHPPSICDRASCGSLVVLNFYSGLHFLILFFVTPTFTRLCRSICRTTVHETVTTVDASPTQSLDCVHWDPQLRLTC